MKNNNPILKMDFPDPDVIRVDDTYYMVSTTMHFFPGCVILRSYDLVHWEVATHVYDHLDDTDKQRLIGENHCYGQGMWAASLRYHNGLFYVVFVANDTHQSYVYTAKEITGKWQRREIKGFYHDCSLFFDDDESVYLVYGNTDIYLTQMKPDLSEPLPGGLHRVIVSDAGNPNLGYEGSHLYKINGKYYLMLAEGGTEYGHMETMQRADDPYGPYEKCPYNPILSHKEDTRERIYCTGHADIMEDANGNWWMVCLAIRPCGGEKNRILMHNLGRETFLAPITWTEDGWPIAGEGGLIDLEMDGPLPGEVQPVCRDFADDFSTAGFSAHYNFVRNPKMENYVRCTEEKRLLLKGSAVTLNDMDAPTLVGVRQKGFETVTTAIIYPQQDRSGGRAGLSAYYNHDYHYEIYVTKDGGKWNVVLAKHIHDMYAVTAQAEISLNVGEAVYLKIESDKEFYHFYYSMDGVNYRKLGSGHVAGLCTEQTRTMTFTGTYLAMFAENGDAKFADFKVKVMDY